MEQPEQRGSESQVTRAHVLAHASSPGVWALRGTGLDAMVGELSEGGA